MTLKRLFVLNVILVGGLVWALSANHLVAQPAPYGVPPTYSALGGYQAPGYQMPGYQAPGYQAPGYQAPGYQAPGYQTPGYQTPGYQVPGYAVPSGYAAYNYPSPVTYAATQPARMAQTGPIAGPPPVTEPVTAPELPSNSDTNGGLPPNVPYASYAVPGQIFNYTDCRRGCAGGGCGPFRRACIQGCDGCGGRSRQWFGGVYGLFMNREDGDAFWTSWDDSVGLDAPLLDIRNSDPGWYGGNELRFGSTFACHRLAWEFVFWGLYGEQDQEVITSADVGGALNTTLDFSGLEYDNGTITGSVNDWYNDAQMHRVYRHFEVQNLEMNLIHFPVSFGVGPCSAMTAGGYGYLPGSYGVGLGAYSANACGGDSCSCCMPCAPRFSIVASAGIRYMRIAEWLDLDTDDADTAFGSDEDELFYDIDLKNHLVGFQLGCATNYRLTNRLAITCDGKCGIYNNHIQHSSLIWGEGGFAVVEPGETYAGQNFDIQSTKDDVAFLGELRLGMTYLLYEHWQLYGGYRVIGLSGVALPVHQIPDDFADTLSVALLDSSGSMIIHGAQFGVEFCY